MGTNMCCLKITNKDKSRSIPPVKNANNEHSYSFPMQHECIFFAVKLKIT